MHPQTPTSMLRYQNCKETERGHSEYIIILQKKPLQESVVDETDFEIVEMEPVSNLEIVQMKPVRDEDDGTNREWKRKESIGRTHGAK